MWVFFQKDSFKVLQVTNLRKRNEEFIEITDSKKARNSDHETKSMMEYTDKPLMQ